MTPSIHHSEENRRATRRGAYKLAVVLCCSSLVTFLILALMERLVRSDMEAPPYVAPKKLEPVVMPPNTKITVQPPRARPKPVETPPPMPKMEFDNIANTDLSLDLAPPVITTAINARNDGIGSDSEALPIVKIAPEYPRRAALRGIEGFVDLMFDISTAGYPINIRILQSQPAGVFDKAASRALARWKYRPKQVDGITVIQRDQSTRIRFDLEA